MFGMNADKLGIKAKDMAFKKLISIYPVYFIINSTIDANTDSMKNVVKIKFFIFHVHFGQLFSVALSSPFDDLRLAFVVLEVDLRVLGQVVGPGEAFLAVLTEEALVAGVRFQVPNELV